MLRSSVRTAGRLAAAALIGAALVAPQAALANGNPPTVECAGYDDVVAALSEARTADRTSVIYVRNDRMEGVPGYGSWWDVPLAEVSESEPVREARRAWEAKRAEERTFL